MTDNQVIQFLKNTSKGRLKYDKNWKEEGRTKVIDFNIFSIIQFLNFSRR